MKNPLNYQTTEFDCGPTTLLNAISFLFKREEIPPDIVRHIVLYCLDAYNGNGEFAGSGTSRMAMLFLSEWLNQFGKAKKFPISCEFLTGESVSVCRNSKIVASLQQGGAVVMRLRYGCWHYVLLTGADEDGVYLFDPYFRKNSFNRNDIEIISDMPYSMNRKVSYDVIDSFGKGTYAVGPKETREAIIVFNRMTQRTAETSVEYYI